MRSTFKVLFYVNASKDKVIFLPIAPFITYNAPLNTVSQYPVLPADACKASIHDAARHSNTDATQGMPSEILDWGYAFFCFISFSCAHWNKKAIRNTNSDKRKLSSFSFVCISFIAFAPSELSH